MRLEIKRNRPTKRATTGVLAIDGVRHCVTLEPPPVADPDGNGYVCIPAGTYTLTIRWSPKFGKLVPHVEDVPGRTAIEIHVGNYPDDTDGCTLAGTDFGDPEQPDYVRFSAKAFSQLMTSLFAGAAVRNPGSPEVNQIWDVGTVAYVDYG